MRTLRLCEDTHLLRELQKEAAGRFCSFRFFSAVRELQSPCVYTHTCTLCDRSNIAKSNFALFSCCGHTGCVPCLSNRIEDQQCPQPNCNAQMLAVNIVIATALEVRENNSITAHPFGAELASLTAVSYPSLPPANESLFSFNLMTL